MLLVHGGIPVHILLPVAADRVVADAVTLDPRPGGEAVEGEPGSGGRLRIVAGSRDGGGDG